MVIPVVTTQWPSLDPLINMPFFLNWPIGKCGKKERKKERILRIRVLLWIHSGTRLWFYDINLGSFTKDIWVFKTKLWPWPAATKLLKTGGFQKCKIHSSSLKGLRFTVCQSWCKPIQQQLNLLCQIWALIWWTYAENCKEISQNIFE